MIGRFFLARIKPAIEDVGCVRLGVELSAELLASVRTTFDELQLCGLICVGGDGSLSIARQLDQYGLPVVGVPTTIDNVC